MKLSVLFWLLSFLCHYFLLAFSRVEGVEQKIYSCYSQHPLQIRNSKRRIQQLKYKKCLINTAEDFPTLGQNNEDVKIWRRFFRQKQHEDLLFVEMGALDGIKFSNTAVFEYCYGWKGILIEPNFKSYVQAARNRPCLHTVWAAVCPRKYQSHAYFSDKAGTSKIISNNISYPSYLGSRVPCRTLSSIFADHEINHIDFFSLDVEGAELYAIRSIDFSKVTISVLIIERNELKKDESVESSVKLAEVEKILTVKAGMVKLPTDGSQVPECQRLRKNMTIGHFNLWGSDLYVEKSLRDDIC